MAYTYFRDAREWGDCGAGFADSWQVLQNAIDACIAQGVQRLYIPRGCKISKPLLLASVYNNAYVGFSLEIFSDANMWDAGSAPTIEALFSDSFIIGVQHGKGVSIKNMWVKGKFVVPAGDDYTFYNRAFADFKDTISRDSRYSPNAAIVIDPFTNGQIPSDGGYPNMVSYYRGNGNTGGSTATTIKDCMTEKTVVGICSSPNGVTQNAELTLIENVQFRNHKLCISGGQSQEKANIIKNVACWYDSHTFFATGKYGAGSSGNWNIDGVNLAGRGVQIIDNEQEGYFPTTVHNIYAEGWFKWFMQNNGGIASMVTNCKINFPYLYQTGFPNFYISGSNIIYKGCIFRIYGSSTPISIRDGSIFKDCSFSGYPLFASSYTYPRFIDCRANAFLGVTGTRTFEGGNRYFPYGDWTLDLIAEARVSYITDGTMQVHDQISSKSQQIYNSLVADPSTSITISNKTGTFLAANKAAYINNQLLKFGSYFAIVTGISGTTNEITISYFDPLAVSGTYNITSFNPIYFNGNFIGDVNANTNTITNAATAQWTYGGGLSAYVGQWIKNPYGGSQYIKILSLTGNTFTFYGSITRTKTGVIFGNYSSEEFFTDNSTYNYMRPGYIIRKGDKVISERGGEFQTEYKVTQGGYIVPPTNDLRKAVLQAIN